MSQGSGAELQIEDGRIAALISQEVAFSWQMRLGGNAAIMANVLAALGSEPVLNAPAITPRLAELLHPRVRLPLNGKLVQPLLAGQARGADREDPVHFVFQFQENEAVNIGRDRISVPHSNRFIATYDPVNSSLLTSNDFDSYCLDNVKGMAGAIVSGLHLAAQDHRQAIFRSKAEQMRSWKMKNPRLFIHAEMGSISSASVMKSLLLTLSEVPVDSLGLNEDEMALALQSDWVDGDNGDNGDDGDDGKDDYDDHDDYELPTNWPEAVRSAEQLRSKLGLFRVAVHTRDYILSVMKKGRIAPPNEISALQSGVSLASSLAATGSLNGPVADGAAEVTFSGQQAIESLLQMDGGTEMGRGAFLEYKDIIASLVPSLLVKRPAISVGLGDTATAAIFLREIEAINIK